MKAFKLIILLLTSIVIFTGCNPSPAARDDLETRNEPVDDEVVGHTLNITERFWFTNGSPKGEDTILSELEAGTVVSDSNFGTIKVNKVTDKEIVLEFDGAFVKREEGKGINLMDDPLKTYTISLGEEIKFSSQTMDVGVSVIVSYK